MEAYQQALDESVKGKLTQNDIDVLKLLQKSQGIATELQISSQLGLKDPSVLGIKLGNLQSKGLVARKAPRKINDSGIVGMGIVRLLPQGQRVATQTSDLEYPTESARGWSLIFSCLIRSGLASHASDVVWNLYCLPANWSGHRNGLFDFACCECNFGEGPLSVGVLRAGFSVGFWSGRS